MPLLIDEVVAEVENTPKPDHPAPLSSRDTGNDQDRLFQQLEILRERQLRLEVD